jgi:hypothetical protein
MGSSHHHDMFRLQAAHSRSQWLVNRTRSLTQMTFSIKGPESDLDTRYIIASHPTARNIDYRRNYTATTLGILDSAV